jgi:hypothetical protein
MPTALSKFVLVIDVIFSYLYASPLFSHSLIQANGTQAGSRPSSSPRKTTTSRTATSILPRSSTAARKRLTRLSSSWLCMFLIPSLTWLDFTGVVANGLKQLLHLRRDVPRDRVAFGIPSRECARPREEWTQRCACHYYCSGLGACVVIANCFLRLV